MPRKSASVLVGNLVYEDELAQVWHGDSRKIVPRLSTVADLIVTDPPYGVDYQSGRGQHQWEKIKGDHSSDLASEVIGLSLGKLRRGRHIYTFGPNVFNGHSVASPMQLVWDKGLFTMGNLEIPWGKSMEEVWFGVHEISKANREKGYGKGAARLRRGSVLRVQRIQSAAATKHPTEKPVPLLMEMIESSSLRGELVLDPFAGVASTGVAATLCGRRSISIEVESAYVETGVERLKRAFEIYKMMEKV